MKASSYNDFEFAKRLWTEAESKADLLAVWEEVCPTGGVGDLWLHEHYRSNPLPYYIEEQRQSMLDHPQTALLQPCWDLMLTFEEWSLIYKHWSHQIDSFYGVIPDATWNTGLINQDPQWCKVFATLNIFTGRCDDIPDWRTLKDRKNDEERALFQQLPRSDESDEFESNRAKWDYVSKEIEKRFSAEDAKRE